MNHSHISITLCRIIVDISRNPLIIAMQYFLRVEIRDTYDLAICTHHNVLHCILCIRSQTCELDPEICAIVSLLELVIIRDCPIIEITYHKDMFSRLGLATCISTEGYFGLIVLIIVDTIDDTCRAISLGRRRRYACKSIGSYCFCTIISRELKVVVTLLSQSVLVCKLCTCRCFHYFTIEFESKISRHCRITSNRNFVIYRRNTWELIDRNSQSFFSKLYEDITIICGFTFF